MAEVDKVLIALQRIQGAPIADGGWMAALAAIAHATGSANAFLVSAGPSEAKVIGTGTDPENLRRFEAAIRGGRMPSWIDAVNILVPQPSSGMISDQALVMSDFYNEVLRHMSAFYGVVAPLHREGRRSVYLMVGRSIGAADYGTDEISMLRGFASSMLTSLQVADRLLVTGSATTAVCSMFNRPNAGVILVDRTARIVFVNDMAGKLLAAADGFASVAGALTATDARTAADLRWHLNLCSRHGIGDLADLQVHCKSRSTPLLATVAPLPAAENVAVGCAIFGQALTVVVVVDPAERIESLNRHLQLRLGLTRSEAAVALEVAQGDGREASAVRLGVSVATVRTHLTHIFNKTGIHRQAELVRTVLACVNDFH